MSEGPLPRLHPASPPPDDPARIARLLLESAAALAQACSAKAIVVAADALPELEAVPPRTLLVTRDARDDDVARKLVESSDAHVVSVPDVELDRMGQVTLAAIISLSNRMLDRHDAVVFLTGPFRSLVDTVVVMTVGAEYELFDASEQPDFEEPVRQAVFHRVLSIALHLGQHGREGRKTGALLVVGDHERVLEQSEQMILNPFRGYAEHERNLLDDTMVETVREYSILDGAFLIRGNGVVERAGARLKAGLSEGLPSGLGARHAAAAGITSTTKAIAITVSESDGTVRVWRSGRMVASFESGRR